MKMLSIEQELKSNSYPGRGIIIGKSPDGKKAVTAYFIMGRSENSRNRVFVEDGEWDFIDCGVTKDFLKKEWQRALEESVTPNCRQQCNACGAARFGCGVCFEPHTGTEEIHEA